MEMTCEGCWHGERSQSVYEDSVLCLRYPAAWAAVRWDRPRMRPHDRCGEWMAMDALEEARRG